MEQSNSYLGTEKIGNLCCRICVAYEHKAFIDGFHYGAQLMKELK